MKMLARLTEPHARSSVIVRWSRACLIACVLGCVISSSACTGPGLEPPDQDLGAPRNAQDAGTKGGGTQKADAGKATSGNDDGQGGSHGSGGSGASSAGTGGTTPVVEGPAEDAGVISDEDAGTTR
jgi:hypothetical protein